jgi:hypothetical protein
MCKTEEMMMGQFSGRFVYLRNSGKVRIFECKMCKTEEMIIPAKWLSME